MSAWLAANRHKLVSASQLTLSVKDRSGRGGGFSWRRRDDDEDNKFDEKALQLLPAAGMHWFKFKGKNVWLNRHIGNPISGGGCVLGIGRIASVV